MPPLRLALGILLSGFLGITPHGQEQRPAHIHESWEDIGVLPVYNPVYSGWFLSTHEDIPRVEVRMAQNWSAVALQRWEFGEKGHDLLCSVEGINVFFRGAKVRAAPSVGRLVVFYLEDALVDKIVREMRQGFPCRRQYLCSY